MIKKISFWIAAAVLSIALVVVVSMFYKDCRTERSGIETDAVVIDIPLQTGKGGPKEMNIAISEQKLPVKISLKDYKNKRFTAGQKVKVKYDAALQHAVLSGETNNDLWFKLCFGVPFVAWLVWSNWRKVFRESS